MSSCGNCGCQIPEVVNIPGLQGDPGVDGAAGISAYTLTTVSILTPASAGPVVAGVTFASTLWMAVGQILWITDGTNFGTFEVTTLGGDGITAYLTWLDYPNDSAGPISIGSGAKVVASGVTPIAGAAILPIANGGTGGSNLATNLLGLPTQFVTGTFVCAGAANVTVANAAISTTSLIIISLNTVGGTVGAIPHVKTIGAGTMDVVGTAADTSTYNYMIIG